MFRRNITSAIADLKQCAAENQIPTRSATLASVRIQGQVGYRRRNLSAKGCLPILGVRDFCLWVRAH
ncbi:MAG: hypothetical protein LBI18_15270 [Planctomycetaceae bacterium]|jgi:hypothetical protein|nr:hypothetical protein [Planctomycetaceae bacterium]